jgi:hypothetical protein
MQCLKRKGRGIVSMSMMVSEALRSARDPVRDRIKDRPICPNCGRPMHLARSTPRAGGLSDLRTYNCGECGVGAIKAADDAV